LRERQASKVLKLDDIGRHLVGSGQFTLTETSEAIGGVIQEANEVVLSAVFES
jgi:hypothetical protein